MGDVSRVLGMNVTRDRKRRTITIDHKDYTEDIIERFGMKGCNPAFIPGAGPELSLDQPGNNLLDEEGKRRYQSIVGAAMYLAQGSQYDILYAMNKLAWGMSKPSKAHIWADKHLLRYWPVPPTSSPTSRGDSRSPSFPMLAGVITQTTINQHPRTSSCSQTAQSVLKWDFKASTLDRQWKRSSPQQV